MSAPGVPAGLRELLRGLGHEVSRCPMTPEQRAEAVVALARLESILPIRGDLFRAGAPLPPRLADAHPARGGVSLAPDAEIVTDSHGVILDANQAAADLLSFRREFLVGKPLPLFIQGARQAGFYTLLVRLRNEGGGVRDWRAYLKPFNGHGVEVLLSVMVTPGNGEPPLSLRWVMRDISLAMQAERALRNERDFAENLLDTAQAIVLVLDGGGLIVRANRFLLQVTGHDEGDLLGRPWMTLLPPEEQEEARKVVLRALARGQACRYTGGLLTRAGLRRAIAWAAKALAPILWDVAGAPGPPNAVLLVGHDITDLQEAQRQALQAERLAALGQALASISHESRNLLQRCSVGVERLRWRLKDQPDALEIIERVGVALQDLTHLFDDIRSYGGTFQLERALHDVGEVWRKAWDNVRAVNPTREATLVEHGDANRRCFVDRFRLKQVFRNVLENAFAACPGPVRIEVLTEEARLDGRPALRVTFRDNGPGLNAEQRQRLFEPFYTTRPGGSGLGMVIARRILDAHGGTISVRDFGPPGAEIVVLLPRGQT
jgi:PAS domain S-box-containing protein